MSATEAVLATPEVDKKEKEFKVKPEKPDDDVYNKELKKLQKEHTDLMDKLKTIKDKLEITKTGGSSNGAHTPQQIKQAELRTELNEIKTTQSSKKSSKAQLQERQKALNDSITTKIAAQKTARGKIPYKSPEDVDHAIAGLERQVDSGTLKLVDERKALADITALRKQRKLFVGFEESQASIDKDREALAELRKQMDDPEQKALSERFSVIQGELNEMKSEQDSVYKNLNSLRDERSKLQAAQQEKFQEMKTLKDGYYGQKAAYRDYENEAWKIKQQRRKEEQDAYMKEKRKKIAAQRMEEASEKAYTNEILTCEGLINYFDPANSTKKSEVQVRELAAQPGRVITETPKGTPLVKKEEDYFIGGGKTKKGKKGKGTPSTDSPATPSAPTASKSFSLSLGILEELSKVDVHPPMAQEDVPATLEKLREKLTYYKDNQEKVTNENIAKAQAEIDKLEADGSTPKEKKVEDATEDKSAVDTVKDTITGAVESLGLTEKTEETKAE